ncbi:MAG: hypothetical protein ACLU3N_13505 [Lachnospiraceae bacterium]
MACRRVRAGPNDWWYMPAYALRDTEIQVNDRICRFVLWNISHSCI